MPLYLKTKPYRFQQEIFEQSCDRNYYGLFLEQGTGKSKIAIDTCSYLLATDQINAIVIICPKSLIYNWHDNEIPKHAADPELFLARCKITNYENLKGVKEYLNSHRCILILDESSKIKNQRAQRTKNILKLSELAAYRRILTGTPVTQGVQDLFSQIEFLKEKIFGNYWRFKHDFLRTVRVEMGSRRFEKIVGHRNIEQLHSILDKFCSRVLKKDVLELPEKIYEQIQLRMNKEQRNAYDTLRQNLILEAEGGTLTTPEIITKMLRLQQISGGFIPLDDSDEMIPIDPNPKIDLIMDLINEGEKIVIWCRFLAEIKALRDRITKQYGPETVVTYQGSNTAKERSEAVDKFQNENAWVFIGNPQTGGMGITLTSCHKVIYYSNDFSLENRLQSEDRVHRIGQHYPVTYTDLIFNRSIDSHVLKSLQNKRNISEIATDFVGASNGLA